MRPSTLLDVLLVYWSVTLASGLDSSDSEGTCDNHHLAATNIDGPHERDVSSCLSRGPTRSRPKQSCMRAAVVEYNRHDDADCRVASDRNLEAYEEMAHVAKENGAKMIVFPEDGILMNSARLMFPCLEEVPEPDGQANPCLDDHDQFPILTRLSCLAQKHGLYVIANYGTKERRNSSDILERGSTDSEQTSKASDYMMLNTDVVFEPSGKYIGRYRKWNPFTESEIFEKAPRLEHLHFDTDYGRFGVFTCFDMMFRKPAIELVEQYHIDTAIFPTWWFDELPLLTAVQFQDGWSATNRVNLLASNILKPARGSLGSSIFSGNRSVYVAPEGYNEEGQTRKSKILLGTIQTSSLGEVCSEDSEPNIIEYEHYPSAEKYRHKNYKLHINDAIQKLSNPFEGSQSVCSGEFCCRVSYKLSSESMGDIKSGKIDAARLIVIARDGPRPGFYQWYEQVCAFATLKRPCGSFDDANALKSLEFDEDALVGFERLSIEASFDTRYVYPACGHSLSKLVERNRRKFECHAQATSDSGDIVRCRLEFEAGATNELYAFGLYARVYERDLKQ